MISTVPSSMIFLLFLKYPIAKTIAPITSRIFDVTAASSLWVGVDSLSWTPYPRCG
jgi:hypothetical protein